jgi:hypothetical protein
MLVRPASSSICDGAFPNGYEATSTEKENNWRYGSRGERDTASIFQPVSLRMIFIL